MKKTTGKVTGVNGNMITVAFTGAVAQNEVVARTAEWSGSAVDYVASEWVLWAIYAFYGAITLVLAGFRRRKASLFQDI